MVDKKIILLKQIAQLIATKSNRSKTTLKNSCTHYLQQNPYDTEIWLKLALITYRFIKDDTYAITCLKNALSYNPGNISITMLLAFIAEENSIMDEKIFEQLCSLQTSNKEVLSLIEYQKAWYYLEKDHELYKYTLECSLDLCNKFVLNYKALGSWYLLHNKLELGRTLFKKALQNVCYIYTPQEYQNLGLYNSDDFFNAYLKGTHIMQPTMLMMLDALK